MIEVDGRRYSFQKLRDGETEYAPVLYKGLGDVGSQVVIYNEEGSDYITGTICEIISGFLYIEPERTAELLGWRNATEMFAKFVRANPNLKLGDKLFLHRLEDIDYVE